ncbi:initiation factor 2 [Wallemia mellicola]|uniref:Translation initiation factor IF-2, mitochondrial n=1 Tax=Wallemia mellicola TaxID=1708541 RepID=A0A4T0RBA5_9BASI|nr:initiation factor 2 [Wallemia mellicola]
MTSTNSRKLSLPQHFSGSKSKDLRANRTSKGSQKLKVLPEEPTRTPDNADFIDDDDDDDEDDDDDDDIVAPRPEVYQQIAKIPAGAPRKDARLLTKKEKERLPRVTAYCTASSYKQPELLKHLESRRYTHGTEPKVFDDVIYTPYMPSSNHSNNRNEADADLLGVPELIDRKTSRYERFQLGAHTPDVFFFSETGVVIMWGMEESMERRVLSMLKRYEVEKLAAEDVEMEDLNFYYATKLALSHALAQSVKISLFEELISATIEQTKDIPQDIAASGKIGMPRKAIMMQIGQLFILRMNINLVGSVLDSPELFWTYPDLEPLYLAFRQYLEIRQRIDLLNARVEVLQDLLRLLKESVYSRHSESLETVVIWLIVVEDAEKTIRVPGAWRPAELDLPQSEKEEKKKTTGNTQKTFKKPMNRNNTRKFEGNVTRNAPLATPATPATPPIDDVSVNKRNKLPMKKKKSNRSSLLDSLDDDQPQNQRKEKKNVNQSQNNSKAKVKPKQKQNNTPAKRQVFIPAFLSVANLSRLFNLRLDKLQRTMIHAGLDNVQFDRVLTAEDASLLAMECGLEPVVNEERAFDLYPSPPHPDPDSLPLRPPIVTIMGHVDHGKTTLLDTLRSSSVAPSEAGGITQHIGAFSVPLSGISAVSNDASTLNSITFLDTPGHAAFTNMRARGASVTDIVVLVVAADDGVMPQTKEVIKLVERSGVGMIVAINKCDKPGVDPQQIKYDLLANNVTLEEFGGEIPSVMVSALTGKGLDDLMDTLAVLSEVKDLRAENTGKAHGVVLESRVDKGKGNLATVLVTRGELKASSSIVGGTTWAKVRQMENDKKQAIKNASAGQPVIVAGWKDLPKAGDEVLEASGEEEAKRAINNRIEALERLKTMSELEVINEKRLAHRELREASQDDNVEEIANEEPSIKELNLVVKGDVSGTVEAFVAALEAVGNKEARVKVITSGVGDINDSDITRAVAGEASIVGFNVKATRSIQNAASMSNVDLMVDGVIYKLLDNVKSRVAELLPPITEMKVLGEATILELFDINVKGRQFKRVAGVRVANGNITRQADVRVIRNGDVVYTGSLETFKHHKKDIHHAGKGLECGLGFADFQEVQQGDIIQSIETTSRPQSM